MARVIELNAGGEITIIHSACGAKIGYYPNEVQSFVHHDYGGGSDMVYYITCPHCGKQIQGIKAR